MDYELLISSSARFIEFAGVGVLLFGALLAAGVFAKHLLDKMTFQDAYHALRADLGAGDPARAGACWLSPTSSAQWRSSLR